MDTDGAAVDEADTPAEVPLDGAFTVVEDAPTAGDAAGTAGVAAEDVPTAEACPGVLEVPDAPDAAVVGL